MIDHHLSPGVGIGFVLDYHTKITQTTLSWLHIQVPDSREDLFLLIHELGSKEKAVSTCAQRTDHTCSLCFFVGGGAAINVPE